MVSQFNDPAYWRDCAAEARLIAGSFTDAKARTQMVEIAERYERMAETAEKLTLVNGNSPSGNAEK